MYISVYEDKIMSGLYYRSYDTKIKIQTYRELLFNILTSSNLVEKGTRKS